MMEHDWRGLLGVFVASVLFVGGLVSVFGRGKATVRHRQSLDGCSVVCPCGTI
jgi:hypothetical protein